MANHFEAQKSVDFRLVRLLTLTPFLSHTVSTGNSYAETTGCEFARNLPIIARWLTSKLFRCEVIHISWGSLRSVVLNGIRRFFTVSIPKAMWRKMRVIAFCLILSFKLAGPVPAQDEHPYLPNPKLTPGEALDVTKDDLCKPEKKDLEDKVPVAVKRQVFDRYSLGANAVGLNVDHLIPISLGGSNSIKNLWPQPLSGEWSYHRKNRLEHRLHKMVCTGDLDLKTAQREIATNWVSAYKKYIGEPGQSPPSQR